jgi:hypothetical protein
MCSPNQFANNSKNRRASDDSNEQNGFLNAASAATGADSRMSCAILSFFLVKIMSTHLDINRVRIYIFKGGGRPGSADYNTLSDSIDDLQNSNNGSNRFDLLKLFWCAIPEIFFFVNNIF